MIINYPDTATIFDIGIKSIFLAGPTPRDSSVASWRPEALKILEERGFTGMVFVPERSDWKAQFNYDDQVGWELSGLSISTVILFWVPRCMLKMPALTTNVEFGMNIKNGNVIYGRPDWATSIKYLDYIYKLYKNESPCNTLESTIERALHEIEKK